MIKRDQLETVGRLVDALRNLHAMAPPADTELRVELVYNVVHPAIPGTPEVPASEDSPGTPGTPEVPERVEPFRFALTLPASAVAPAISGLTAAASEALASHGIKVS